MLCAIFGIVPGLMDQSIQTLKTQEWTECSLRDNVYSAKFSVKTRLEHGFPIEYMHFQ